MKCSKPGQFYGENNETVFLKGIILDDSDYLKDRVDWHFHENAYFTFILEGSVLEGSKNGINECSAGSLLFHNWQDPHYNIGSKEFTRGFHVEIETAWFGSFDISTGSSEGSINITDPAVKILMYNIFKETKLGGVNRQLAIDALLVETFSLLSTITATGNKKKPAWVNTIRDALHATTENWQLTDLAKLANIHPVHLSREFSKYFNATLGDYIRTIKVQRALSLLPNKDLSLTDISIECGFADQSHFIRSFKSLQQLTPLHYRKLLLNKATR
jgi:AraC family transcriptional regulator